MNFMYSDITDHSRNLMSSEGSKIEQIGTQKSELGALLIEGIHASRSQKSVDRAFKDPLSVSVERYWYIKKWT